MKFRRVDEIVQWRLCMGCGACVNACPGKSIRLVDVVEKGLRPVVDPTKCQGCGDCVKVCPGIEIRHSKVNEQSISELRQAWGPVLDVWEGYANDEEVRYRGSSGGVATALGLFCLEKESFSGVLHIGFGSAEPLKNIPVFSRDREALIRCTGSRYSPAAPCEKLSWIKDTESPCIFIGKPCDVVALRKSQVLDPQLRDKVGLAVSIFCAGTPPAKGTFEILNTLGIRPEEVKELRYRGCGWPGMTRVETRNDDGKTVQMTYEKSWNNILSRHGQVRCRICPDSTGEFADIACGDPWHCKIETNDLGRSLVLVRTERGRDLLAKAIKSGYVNMERVEASVLPRSQPSLLDRRRNLFGRLLTMRVMGVPIPEYIGFSFFKNWLDLTTIDKFRSIGGTIKRVVLRKWNKSDRELVSTA